MPGLSRQRYPFETFVTSLPFLDLPVCISSYSNPGLLQVNPVLLSVTSDPDERGGSYLATRRMWESSSGLIVV